MANNDLGTIPYTNVNAGTSVVDKTAQVRAGAQLLNAGKTIVDEGIKYSVSGDMLDQIEAADQDELGAVNTPDQMIDPNKPEMTQREAHLTERMDKLITRRDQGKYNQRQAAEMGIKRILTEASAKYPWLAEDLQRRAGVILRTNPDLDRLALEDASEVSFQDMAAKEIQRLYDFSIKPVKDNGLGLSPSLVVGSREWIRQYTIAEDKYGDRQQADWIEAMALANATLDLDGGGADDAYRLLHKETGALQSQIDRTLAEMDYDILIEQIRLGDQGDFAFIERWREEAPVHGRKLMNILNERKDALKEATVSPAQARVPEGQALLKSIDDRFAVEEEFAQHLIDGAKDLPSAVARRDNYQAARQMRMYQGLSADSRYIVDALSSPAMRAVNDAIAAGALPSKLHLFNNTQTKASKALQELFGLGNGMSVDDANKRGVNTGEAMLIGLTPNFTPADLNRSITQHLAQSTDPYMLETQSQQEEIKAAWVNAETAMKLWDVTENFASGHIGPQMAGFTLTRLNTSMHSMNQSTKRYSDAEAPVLEHLASDAMTRIVTAANEGPGKVMANAFATTATGFFERTRPTDRRDQMAQLYATHTVGGVPLSQLAYVESDAINNGSFEWIVDQDAVNRAVQSQATKGVPTSMIRADIELSINGAMGQIAKEVNTQINIRRNLGIAASANPQELSESKADYFQRYFYDENTGWYNAFNYRAK